MHWKVTNVITYVSFEVFNVLMIKSTISFIQILFDYPAISLSDSDQPQHLFTNQLSSNSNKIYINLPT